MKFERRLAPKDSPDFFPTPKCATKALLAYERFDGNVLEPACGKGDISKVFNSFCRYHAQACDRCA